ncbi:MAG: DUF460 domain-containing protein [Candidatus Woesearchaeota archaeon]
MDKRSLVIAGIDPGTTTGFCLIDLQGRIISLQSGKQLTLERLISKTVDSGRIILAGCDKKNVPLMVQKFSAQFNIKVEAPVHDLLQDEKKELVGNTKTMNTHEFDSVASASFALKQVSPLVRKIRFLLKEQNRQDLFDRVAEIVIRKRISVRLAFDMITKPQKEEVKVAVSATQEERVSKERVLKLYEGLQQEKSFNALLKQENQQLRKELEKQKEIASYLRGKIDKLSREDGSEQRQMYKQEQQNNLKSRLRALYAEIEELKRELHNERSVLADSGDKTIAKKLRNLGSQEFEKKSRFIRQGDVLVVDDPGIVSESVIERLKQLHAVLIVKKHMSPKALREIELPVANAETVRMKESRYFASIDKKAVERISTQREFLKKIVKSYQAERRS